MENSAELSGKYLGTISQDFIIVAETLREASYQLKARKISDFPIFPISKNQIPVGQLLLGKKEVATEWNYHFSYLEEFQQLMLIMEDKVDEFKSRYKDSEEFCCLFVVDEDFTNFVFIPYPED